MTKHTNTNSMLVYFNFDWLIGWFGYKTKCQYKETDLAKSVCWKCGCPCKLADGWKFQTSFQKMMLEDGKIKLLNSQMKLKYKINRKIWFFLTIFISLENSANFGRNIYIYIFLEKIQFWTIFTIFRFCLQFLQFWQFRQFQWLVAFETLITILTIEILNSQQSL